MPDISMCTNDKCKLKEECYRFTATPDEYRQSYSPFDCKDTKGQGGYFWSNKPYKEVQREAYYLDIKKKNT
jgi:hypothetical protein